ncbi:MAG: PASTA domain-containing protein [Actinobacteria bacterium]|nr:PASTA domain-containing protein [Actinomycetota bacterium]
MANPRMSAEIGRVLGGRYRLVAPIGLGASAQVYLADDVRLRRRVALKMLHDALADDTEFLRRFRAEAQAAAALSHPNVLAVYDWGDDDIAFIVTEYLGGGSLRALLDQGGLLSPSQALAVGLEAARALDYAHRRGFVHRDIKPANLLFGDDQRLRIADFGLARALAEAAWTEPQGAMLGTARYASPEQAKGEKLSGKADVYALALVLVEAVTGEVPFTADTTLGTLMARVDRPLEVPEALGPLRRVLTRAGHPDPEQRIDARTMAAGLLRAAKELPRPEPLALAGALSPTGLAAVDDDPTIHAPTIARPADPEPDPDLNDGDLDLAPPDWVNGAEPVVIDPEPDPERVAVPAAAAALAAGTALGAAATTDGGPGVDDAGAGDGSDDPPGAGPGDGSVIVLPGAGGGAPPSTSGPSSTSGPGSAGGTAAGAAATTVLERPTTTSGTAENPVLDLTDRDDGGDGGFDGDGFDDDGRRRRRRWPWVLLVLAILAGSAGTAAAVVANRDDSNATAQPALVLPVPNVEGMTRAEAEELLTNSGWTVEVDTERRNDTVKGDVLSITPAAGTRLARSGTVQLLVSAGQEMVALPEGIEGKPLAEVEATLAEVGLVGEVVARTFDEDVAKDGIISYAEGTATKIERGSTVGLVASDGPEPRTVPNVRGKTEAEARAVIEGLQLEVAVNENYSDDVAEGKVISQLPAGGSELPRGDTVTIEVSLGPEMVKVPSVASADTPAEAAQILRDAGLVPGSVSGSAEGTPRTSPAAGTEVRSGSKVDIILG